MSMYNERYDDALSKACWVSKTIDNGRTYLFKYAPHPERTGYLFVATDLQTVHFEALMGSSIPSRLEELARKETDEDEEPAALSLDEQQKQTDSSLATLLEVFEGGLGNATVETESDDYFDAVFLLRHESFSWKFNMTHLVSPLTALLAQDRGVEMPRSGSDRLADAIGAVISDAGVARALRRVTGAPPPMSGRGTPRPRTKTASPTPRAISRAPSGTGLGRVPSMSKLSHGLLAVPKSPSPPRTKSPSPHRTPQPPSPQKHSQSQGLPPLLPPSSPTPHAKRHRVYDFAAGILPSSSPQVTSMDGEELEAQQLPIANRAAIPPTPRRRAHASPDPPSSPPFPPLSDPSSTPASSDLPTSTFDPLVPSLPQKKKKKKVKKDEAEEEAEADRRRAAMKKRMAAGTGGGLGRRRLR